MLLANISVAEKISTAFPKSALLRSHPSPDLKKLEKVAQAIAESLPEADKIDISSSGSIHSSLQRLEETFSGSQEIVETITFMCTKPMNNAIYFSTREVDDSSKWNHYALSVSRYTHFTSPIRRYPDIIVHRLLIQSISADTAASIGTQSIEEIAAHSNERKLSAKNVQERMIDFYVAEILMYTPMVVQGIACAVGGSQWIDVYVPLLGTDLRVWLRNTAKENPFNFVTYWRKKEKYVLRMVV